MVISQSNMFEIHVYWLFILSNNDINGELAQAVEGLRKEIWLCCFLGSNPVLGGIFLVAFILSMENYTKMRKCVCGDGTGSRTLYNSVPWWWHR